LDREPEGRRRRRIDKDTDKLLYKTLIRNILQYFKIRRILIVNRFFNIEEVNEKMNRKGVSEIISALLLILLAVTLGMIMVTYSMDVFNSAESNFDLKVTSEKERIEERLVITKILDYTDGQSKIDISIYNFGERTVEISDVYVDMETTDFKIYEIDGTLVPDNIITTGELQWINCNGLPDPLPSEVSIIISTGRGNTYEVTYNAEAWNGGVEW
jgi:flagellin-like protein